MASNLLIQAARFGDLVQSKRLLLSLRRQGRVHLAVDAGLAPLARLLYPFAQVYGLAAHGGGSEEAALRAVETNRAVLARWRAERFDKVFNCNFSGLTTALCRVFEPESVVGYRPAPGGTLRSPWARTAFRLSGRRALSSLNLADFWAHFVPDPVPAAEVNPVASPGGQGLGVVLAGRESRRSLPVPLLAQVLQTAFGALGGPRVRLLGTAAEQPAARRLLRLLPPRMLPHVEDLSGKTDWAALTETVSGMDALLTPDTGIMHLAAHLGVPVLGFFLSSAWSHETGPYGCGHHIWQASLSCAPCLESAPCPVDTACRRPFEGPELLRSLALVLKSLRAGARPAALPPLPVDLQLWESGVDALGGVLRLRSGEDAGAALRGAVRGLLAEMLHLPGPPCPEGAGGGEEREAVCRWLFNETDWMLPPGRYC